MRALSSWVVAGLVAGLVLAVIELVALGGPGGDVAIAVVGLLLGLGFAIGAVASLTEAVIVLAWPGPAMAALLRALPAALPLRHLGAHLFDGGRAATLPGASTAGIWIPIGGTLLVALALRIGAWILGEGGAGRRGLLLVVLVAGVVACELVNRRMFVSGYPDAHLFLVVLSCAALTLAIGLALGADRRRAPGAGGIVVGALGLALASSLLIGALSQGLASREGRTLVATRGAHARHLIRVARAAVDRDGDGFSPVLGGGDCDDAAAAINPGAPDTPGNAVDEDCDGSDLATLALAADDEEEADGEDAAPDPRGERRAARARKALLRRTARMNVVFLSVDALRADALTSADMPRLAALVGSGASFARAFSPGAGTDLSLGAVTTGRIDPWTVVPTTLAEALVTSGRSSHGVFPREVLRYAGRTLLARGLEGLDEVVNDREQRDVSNATSSIETTDVALAALERLGGRERPFFLWVHYFDAHEHLQIRADDRALGEVAGGRALGDRAGKYRALLGLVDREIGRLLDGLAARGAAARTIVVVFGDHGESLGEDARLPDNHGKYVYDPLVRIPLAIVVPKAPPRTSTVPISLLDLAPTVLDLLGLPPLEGQWGRSLVPLLLADEAKDPLPEPFAGPRALPLHESDQWGVVRWPLKLLVRPADNLVELYDLEADPRERRDLSSARPSDVAALKALNADFPAIDLDRTTAGRARREALARRPARR
jgi:choline-sulfatase